MLLDRIRAGELDSTIPMTHRVPLDQAPAGYRAMKYKDDGAIKVVLKP
jgi:threonine dehydrogenase-like Zn-dependent dehydrogenase